MGSYGGGSGGYPGLGGGVSRKQWGGETTEEEPHDMYIIWDYGCMDGGGRLIRCDVKVIGGKAKRGPNSCPYLLFNKPVCLLTYSSVYVYRYSENPYFIVITKAQLHENLLFSLQKYGIDKECHDDCVLSTSELTDRYNIYIYIIATLSTY